MGSRANLIIIESGNTEIYYTHHRAQTLDRDLFWGPQYALGFIRSQQVVTDGQLLDEIFAEGGAVMDLDMKALKWFGGAVISDDVNLRRLHLKLMSSLWSGWTVRHAAEGVVDLAKYLNLPLSMVLSNDNEPRQSEVGAEKLIRPINEGSWNTLASVKFENGTFGLCRLKSFRNSNLFVGPDILPVLESASLPPYIEINSRFPREGFHVDVAEKELLLWSAEWCEDIVRRVHSRWPGWTVHWHEDRYESQLERTMGRLRFSPQNQNSSIRTLRDSLLRPNNNKSAADTTIRAAQLLTGQSDIKQVQINPAALNDAQLVLPLELRTQLFDQALSASNIVR